MRLRFVQMKSIEQNYEVIFNITLCGKMKSDKLYF